MTGCGPPTILQVMPAEPPSIFDTHPELYDALVDWPRRLAREEAFYRQLFASIGAARVLDSACGTGHHAAMFHGWGLQVEGSDLSPGMIDYCRRTYGEPAGLSWVVRSFAEPVSAPGAFDVALCVGNSLALADDPATVDAAVRALMSAVRPGGAVVLHVLNLWRLPEGPTAWQKCRRVTLDGQTSLLLKGVHRSADRGHIDMISIAENGGENPRWEHRNNTLLGLKADDLAAAAQAAGADRVDRMGSVDRQPYVAADSVDLILVCRRKP